MRQTESSWSVPPEEAGSRLDVHLAQRLDMTRSQAQRWIREGAIELRAEARRVKAKASTVVESGVHIHCTPPPVEKDPDLKPEAGELDILHVDEDIVVVNKPANLAIHPGAGRQSGTLVNRLLHHYPEIATLSGRGRPGIVHRLDLDTTGAVIVARSEAAMRRLQQAFADRQISKTYIALVHGIPSPAEGVVESPIGRHPQDRKRMTVRGDGRPARTGYRVTGQVTERAKIAARLELDLHTGRTHQIRVHMKALGHPLIGDPTYGEARWRTAPKELRRLLSGFPRPALHAWRLGFDHPIRGEGLEIQAPVPADLKDLWVQLGGRWSA